MPLLEGCAIVKAVSEGRLPEEGYRDYLKINEEVKEEADGKRRKDKAESSGRGFPAPEKGEMDILVRLGIRSLHYDVMDGNFVRTSPSGETFRPPLSPYGKKIDFDVHLMTKDPLRHVRQFYALGARNIAIHYETLDEGMDGIKRVKDELPGLSLSLAFSPGDEDEPGHAFPFPFDGFLVMSVVPGKRRTELHAGGA